MVDNTLWSGRVADPELRKTDEITAALVECIESVKNDARVEICTLMIADGFTVLRKK